MLDDALKSDNSASAQPSFFYYGDYGAKATTSVIFQDIIIIAH